LDLGLGTQGLG